MNTIPESDVLAQLAQPSPALPVEFQTELSHDHYATVARLAQLDYTVTAGQLGPSRSMHVTALGRRVSNSATVPLMDDPLTTNATKAFSQ